MPRKGPQYRTPEKAHDDKLAKRVQESRDLLKDIKCILIHYLQPQRASKVEALITSEPLEGEYPMQFKIGAEGVKVTLSANGSIDEAPTWTNDGPSTLVPDSDGMTAHDKAPSGPGVVNFVATCKVDNPDTGDTIETIQASGSYEWIPATAARATEVTATVESEPLTAPGPTPSTAFRR